MIHVVSVRVGKKYGPEYSAILHDMVARNISTLEHAHWEITDDPEGLLEGINSIAPAKGLPGWWQKVYLFSDQMPWKQGDRVIYFDLDVAITGRLEDLPKGIIQDWAWPMFNSSVMSWDHGEHGQIWSKFDPAIIDQRSKTLPVEALPPDQVNGGDQEWITQAAPDFPPFPQEYFPSWRWNPSAKEWPPMNSKAVIFHGDPKPSDIKGGWVPDIWKIGGYTSIPVLGGVNVSDDVVITNIASSSARDLPWFQGAGRHSGVAVLVCGGPSMKDSLPQIRAQKARGARIITVNNALAYLVDRGITPDSHIMLDARPENAIFLKNAPKSVQYFLASQCHADVYDALKDHGVTVWHNMIGDEGMTDILAQYAAEKVIVPVPGGGTVGLRALNLIWFSGYRKIHVYGLDSSISGDDHHAYAQPMNDGEETFTVVHGGKKYTCAKWMARQAEEFQDQWQALQRANVALFVHGTGLIPDIAKQLRKEAA